MKQGRSAPARTGLSGFLDADGLKRAIAPVAAFVASFALIGLASLSGWWLLGLAVTLPVLALGVFDALQTGNTLTRNYPFAARIRWLFTTSGPICAPISSRATSKGSRSASTRATS